MSLPECVIIILKRYRENALFGERFRLRESALKQLFVEEFFKNCIQAEQGDADFGNRKQKEIAIIVLTIAIDLYIIAI